MFVSLMYPTLYRSITQITNPSQSLSLKILVMNIQNFEPLRHIALAVSGGGFRAACFGLGAMSYLHRIGLLSHVKFMSSASGGSFPVALYGQYIHQGKTFEQCYQHLYECLEGEKLIEKAFDLLEDTSIWAKYPDKNKNLINAFALAYDALVFEGGSLDKISTNGLASHIDEICINTTEFNNGISFRFQQGTGQRNIGNYYLFFDRQKPNNHALKFGDIVAASSAFPGGMEPMVFPEDFTHNTLTKDQLWSNFIQKPYFENQYKNELKSFGLMDGGIDDNQALESVVLADQWRQKNVIKNEGKFPVFDTIIVCDVDSGFMKGYQPPKAKITTNWLQQKGLRQCLKYLDWAMLAVVVVPILLGLAMIFTGVIIWGGVIGTIGLLATGVYVYFRQKIKTQLTAKSSNTFVKMMQKYGGFFLDQPLASLYNLGAARARSASMLVGDMFLNQIRRLHYKIFYQNPAYDQRRVSVLSHDLSFLNRSNLKKNLSDTVSEKMAKTLANNTVIETLSGEARAVATTLWFDEAATNNRSREKIIANGQVTMCFNLLKYLGQLEKDEVALPDHLINLKNRLENDWEDFKIDPMRLLPT
jgi:hypothetical protein